MTSLEPVPLLFRARGTTWESLIEGAKQKHTQREGLYDLRIRCRGVGHKPPKVETGGEEATSRGTQRQDGGSTEQRYPTPRQQLLEADKRHRRRLAALARDHIMKLREERDRMAYDWSEEYAKRASSA